MFHIYGLLIGFSVLILIWVSELLLLRGGKDKRLIGEAVSFILFPALIGARVYHVIHLWEYYSSNLTAIWRIWEGGLAIWGAVIGGMIGIMLFSRKKARDVEERAVEIFLTLADVLAIVMPLAQSVGRMGNFFNEELYGRETDLPWGIVVSGREGVYHPLFAYEAILNLVLFVILLTLFGKNELDVHNALRTANLPRGIKEPKRKYYSVVIVEFTFRGIPQKAGQHYVFGGRSEISFKAYAMNEEEIKLFDKELKKSEVNEMLTLIEGSTTASLDEIQKDLDHFLKDKDEDKEKQEEKKKAENTNPFSVLFSPLFKSQDAKKPEDVTLDKLKKDSYPESLVRALAAVSSGIICFELYDVYKKGHGMASHDNPFE